MIPESFFFWVRGTGFQIAVALFVGGMVFRMAALALMARRKSLAEPRGSEWGPGLRMIWRRSFVLPQLGFRGKLTFVSGYLFHHKRTRGGPDGPARATPRTSGSGPARR